MEISALQKARSSYQPKLPKGLRGNVDIIEGAPTESVGDQDSFRILMVCLSWNSLLQRR